MIKFDLNNRVAIVTGGAQGFGLAIVERFISTCKFKKLNFSNCRCDKFRKY